jgi:phospholipid/cholesterol/gamma-HCH transport system substrate-binding protein
LLELAGPVLAEARPLLADLRPLAADLRPLLHGLNPLVGSASGVLADVNGSVINRVRGPVLSTVLAPYRGTTPFYKEFAYMLSGLDATSDLTDRNGATIAFDPGVGVQTVGGTGVADPLTRANAQGVKGR